MQTYLFRYGWTKGALQSTPTSQRFSSIPVELNNRYHHGVCCCVANIAIWFKDVLNPKKRKSHATAAGECKWGKKRADIEVNKLIWWNVQDSAVIRRL